MWLCRHCWCSSAPCPQPKGHSGFPMSRFPTILNTKVHFIRSRMPRSGTHLKCRWVKNNSHFPSFSLILAEGSLWASGWPIQGLWEPWSIWVWPEESHISCLQAEAIPENIQPTEDRNHFSLFIKKPQSNFTVVGTNRMQGGCRCHGGILHVLGDTVGHVTEG